MSDIETLPVVFKLARENAILGNYLDSIKHYQDGINIIRTFADKYATKATKEQWKFVEGTLVQELTNVQEIVAINDSFTNSFGSVPKGDSNNGLK